MKDERILAENIRVSNDTRITKLNNNDLIIGSSGCGKTGGYVIPNIQNITGSLIVSDTKGQLHRMFKEELEAKGYKVYALDLVNPLASCGWNPIRNIRTYPDDSYYEQDILTFANTIMPVLDRYEPFWEKAAAAYIAFLVSFCLEAVHESGHNMRNIFSLHNTFITPQGEMPFAEWVCEHPDSFTASRYNRIASVRKVEKTWECIIEFANRALEPFGFKEVGHIFENENSIDILELGREKTVLFINNSDTDRTFDAITNVFYTQALQLLCSEADKSPDGRLKVPVRIIMDDFASGTRIPNFDKVISVIRSRDISVSIILQSLTQLESMYSHAEALTIINNCDHLLFLGSNDVETAEYLSYRLCKMPETILSLSRDKAMLVTSGEKARIVDKVKPYSTISHNNKNTKNTQGENTL